MPEVADDSAVISIPPERVAMAHRGILVAMLVELIRSEALERETIIGRLHTMAMRATQEAIGEDVAAEMALVSEMTEVTLDYDQPSH